MTSTRILSSKNCERLLDRRQSGKADTRVRRILYVSRQFPQDIAKSVHGVYILMRLFLDAIVELADDIEMLFYVAGVSGSIRPPGSYGPSSPTIPTRMRLSPPWASPWAC